MLGLEQVFLGLGPVFSPLGLTAAAAGSCHLTLQMSEPCELSADAACVKGPVQSTVHDNALMGISLIRSHSLGIL